MKSTRELALIIGIPKRVVRYYKDKGLIRPASKDISGYDLYDDTMIDRIIKIENYRRLGMMVKDIKLIIADDNYLNNEVLDNIISKLINDKNRHNKWQKRRLFLGL